jgi:hypothetical protein
MNSTLQGIKNYQANKTSQYLEIRDIEGEILTKEVTRTFELLFNYFDNRIVEISLALNF